MAKSAELSQNEPEQDNAALPTLLRTPQRPGLLRRWWIYQRERFPLASHGPVIAAFSFCMVSYSTLVRGAPGLPALPKLLVAFVSAFLFFLQMRIADEFKDFEDDLRYRPYRPVPRGLITLRELGTVALLGGLIQLALALWLSPALLPFLLGVWLYLGLMSREFFVSRWLKAHPVVYMWSHMLIIPLIDLYGTACDWRTVGAPAPDTLFFLLCVSFFNGFALELGRKIRSPQDEEYGVETYSFLWGRARAVSIWLGTLVITAICISLAASHVGTLLPTMLLFVALLACGAWIGICFVRQPLAGRGRWLENFAGGWTLLVYLSLGVLPLFWQFIIRGG